MHAPPYLFYRLFIFLGSCGFDTARLCLLCSYALQCLTDKVDNNNDYVIGGSYECIYELGYSRAKVYSTEFPKMEYGFAKYVCNL